MLSKLLKLWLVLSFLGLLGGCAIDRGKNDLSMTIGKTQSGSVAHVGFSVDGDGALTESFGLDPVHGVDYAAMTIKRWAKGIIGLFPAKAPAGGGG